MAYEKREPRRNVSLKVERDLYIKIEDYAGTQGITPSNAMENMFKYFLRLPVSDKPTKRGRSTKG